MKEYSFPSTFNKFDSVKVDGDYLTFENTGYGRKQVSVTSIKSVETQSFTILNRYTKFLTGFMSLLLGFIWLMNIPLVNSVSDQIFAFEVFIVVTFLLFIVDLILWSYIGEIVIRTSSSTTRIRGSRGELDLVFKDIIRVRGWQNLDENGTSDSDEGADKKYNTDGGE